MLPPFYPWRGRQGRGEEEAASSLCQAVTARGEPAPEGCSWRRGGEVATVVGAPSQFPASF